MTSAGNAPAESPQPRRLPAQNAAEQEIHEQPQPRKGVERRLLTECAPEHLHGAVAQRFFKHLHEHEHGKRQPEQRKHEQRDERALQPARLPEKIIARPRAHPEERVRGDGRGKKREQQHRHERERARGNEIQEFVHLARALIQKGERLARTPVRGPFRRLLLRGALRALCRLRGALRALCRLRGALRRLHSLLLRFGRQHCGLLRSCLPCHGARRFRLRCRGL